MEKRQISFDYQELDKKIIEVFRTHGKFAEKMGLSSRSESLKMNNIREWKQSEMLKAANLLGFAKAEIPFYFFTAEVQ